MMLIDEKNENFLDGFYKYHVGGNPDVPDDQMALSESKSKFSMIACTRHTFILGMPSTLKGRPRKQESNERKISVVCFNFLKQFCCQNKCTVQKPGSESRKVAQECMIRW